MAATESPRGSPQYHFANPSAAALQTVPEGLQLHTLSLNEVPQANQPQASAEGADSRVIKTSSNPNDLRTNEERLDSRTLLATLYE